MKPPLDKFDLTGRVALVTGAAGMLGGQFTRGLLQAGACVIVADVRSDAAHSAAQAAMDDVGGKAIPAELDVRDKSQVEELMTTLLDDHGLLDVLVNNAAMNPKVDPESMGRLANTFEDYPLDLWRESLDVNLTGVFLCCQGAGKIMVSQGSGAIINICSTYGLVAPDQR
ncbi:MAG: SDR family NAD(P)-dependent oxidoreductase, partial [Planctomycetales bacterium]